MWWRSFACSRFLGCRFFFLYSNHLLVQEESVTSRGCEHPYFLRRGCSTQSKMYFLCLAELPQNVCGSPRSRCPWDVLYADRAARSSDSQAVCSSSALACASASHSTALRKHNLKDGISKNFKMAATEHWPRRGPLWARDLVHRQGHTPVKPALWTLRGGSVLLLSTWWHFNHTPDSQ